MTTTQQYWNAIQNKDKSFDGLFYYGVITTGIYCRPSCPSRIPLQKNVRFYASTVSAQADGLRPCQRCHPDSDNNAISSLMLSICEYIQQNSSKQLTLAHLSDQASMSSSHFHRSFKKALGITPRKYLEACRMNTLKAQLKNGVRITDAIMETGYESSSRIYEKLDSHLGMTPGSYQKGGSGEVISYASGSTLLGNVMIGATDRGICFLQFENSQTNLLEQLKTEFSKATLTPMPSTSLEVFKQWLQSLNLFLDSKTRQLELPLDIHGTIFQRLVWDYLINIPPGTVKTYAQVAQGINKPKAVRAVATACASNKIAIAIPCHRVIRGDGNLAGYKWGLARKKRLIALENKQFEQ